MSFQGRIENGSVVLEAPISLPNGTLVRIEPVTLAKVEPAPCEAATDSSSPAERLRVPSTRVRISVDILHDEPEWSRLDYRMGLAVEKFYESEDAYTKNP